MQKLGWLYCRGVVLAFGGDEDPEKYQGECTWLHAGLHGNRSLWHRAYDSQLGIEWILGWGKTTKPGDPENTRVLLVLTCASTMQRCRGHREAPRCPSPLLRKPKTWWRQHVRKDPGHPGCLFWPSCFILNLIAQPTYPLVMSLRLWETWDSTVSGNKNFKKSGPWPEGGRNMQRTWLDPELKENLRLHKR